jgi:hypothetical protein
MLEICPICADIMSEINAMSERDHPISMEDLTWAELTGVRGTLVAMYTEESVVHFVTSWNLLRNGYLHRHAGLNKVQLAQRKQVQLFFEE